MKNVYRAAYTGPVVHFDESADEAGFLSAAALTGKDSMEISVHGNGQRILLTARYDNLGKGASGAAVQCMNLVLGRRRDGRSRALNKTLRGKPGERKVWN